MANENSESAVVATARTALGVGFGIVFAIGVIFVILLVTCSGLIALGERSKDVAVAPYVGSRAAETAQQKPVDLTFNYRLEPSGSGAFTDLAYGGSVMNPNPTSVHVGGTLVIVDAMGIELQRDYLEFGGIELGPGAKRDFSGKGMLRSRPQEPLSLRLE